MFVLLSRRGYWLAEGIITPAARVFLLRRVRFLPPRPRAGGSYNPETGPPEGVLSMGQAPCAAHLGHANVLAHTHRVRQCALRRVLARPDQELARRSQPVKISPPPLGSEPILTQKCDFNCAPDRPGASQIRFMGPNPAEARSSWRMSRAPALVMCPPPASCQSSGISHSQDSAFQPEQRSPRATSLRIRAGTPASTDR